MGLLKLNQNHHLHLEQELKIKLLNYPYQYDQITIREDIRPTGFLFYPFSYTIEALYKTRELVVCGEGFSHEEAFTKCFSELIERSCMIDEVQKCPKLGTTSNGWAVHTDYGKSYRACVFEKVERDAVLAQWYSQTPFVEVDFETLSPDIQFWVKNELSRSEFPIFKLLLSTKGIGPSFTVLLMNAEGFGVCGHSTKLSSDAAIQNAIGEACRSAQMYLRNLHYDETEKLDQGSVEKINPAAHGLYYAYQKPFPTWIFGEKMTMLDAHLTFNKRNQRIFEMRGWQIYMFGASDLFVGKADHEMSFDLEWGATLIERLSKQKAFSRLKNKTINLEPHPIA